DELYPAEAPARASSRPDAWEQTRTRLSINRSRIALAVSLAFVATLVWFLRPRAQPAAQPIAAVQTTAPAPTAERGETDEPSPPPPPKVVPVIDWLRVAKGAALVFGLLMSALWAYDYRNLRTASARATWRRALESLPGPFGFRWNVSGYARWVSKQELEATAVALSRRFGDTVTTSNLDVSNTLRLTLRAGLRPHLVFQRARPTDTIVVAVDTYYEMRPWQGKIDELLAGLQKRGIHLERWTFDADARRPSGPRGLGPVALESLARQRSLSPLLMISPGAGVAAALAEPDRSWVRQLERWKRRAWLNPIGDPDYWRAELARLPVHVRPMTGAGIRFLAGDLTADRPRGGAPALRARRRVRATDIERMKRLLSLVPYPSLALAELLPQRFLPHL